MSTWLENLRVFPPSTTAELPPLLWLAKNRTGIRSASDSGELFRVADCLSVLQFPSSLRKPLGQILPPGSSS